MKKLLYSIASILFVACGDGVDNNEQLGVFTDLESHQEEEKIISMKSLKELKNASKVVYTFPPPIEIADILFKTKAVYDVEILNNPNRTTNYITDYKRALNLGVYFADLSFTSMFDYPQDAMKCIGAAQALSEELNIQGVFTDNLMMRLEDNMSNKDSLLDIVASTYMETELYLEDNEREFIAQAILLGAWIEGLYIAVNLRTDYEQESQIWDKVGEQKPALNNLVSMVKEGKDPIFKDLIVQLDSLETIFNEVNLTFSKDSSNVNTEKETKALITSAKVDISRDVFERIQSKITEIRSVIIQ